MIKKAFLFNAEFVRPDSSRMSNSIVLSSRTHVEEV